MMERGGIYLFKARESLAGAISEFVNDRYNNCANRAYYAVFQAAIHLVRSPEDPASLHLLAIADVDDPDEVGDLVVDRVVTLLVEEGIPLHVIPMRTPERIEAALAAGHRGGSTRTVRLWDD